MFKIRSGLLVIIIVAIAGAVIGSEGFRNWATGFFKEQVAVTLTAQAHKHILRTTRGKEQKGGSGMSCRTTFPPDWDDAKIISAVKKIASNDNLDWVQQKNNYYQAEKSVDGVMVRVVLDSNKGSIITAYPLNDKRKACME